VSAAGPAALTPRLREIVDALHAARSRLVTAVVPLDQARMDAVSSSGGWSVGEILHHLQVTERSVARVVAKQVERAAAQGGGPDPRTDSVLGSLDRFDIERPSPKLVSPQGVVPTPGISRQALLDGLASSRAVLLAEVEKAAAYDLSRLSFPHPALGRLDLYQWLLFVAQHELRHLHQVERSA
jgi:hypothetical protein